jgi:glycosyltransferase involved in cell wall biosynthesis
MKKISIMIPCWNEKDNIRQITEAVRNEIMKSLPEYDYEIVIIDNKSTDGTRDIIRELCKEDAKVKAIFNMKNFGQFNSPYYGLTRCSGDCVIPVCADFQDPVELIPVMVHKWEEGNKVICMVKSKSEESKIMYFLRGIYYSLIKKMSSVEQIKQFTGFGLYDQSFIQVMRQIKDPMPFLRGIIAEYAPDHLEMEYTQPQRRAGKTHNNFFTLFDAAMLSFTSYTKGLRIATFLGFIISVVSFLIGLVYLVLKVINWNDFSTGVAPILISVFFLGGVQLAFLGFLGEYVMSMNQRVVNRPLVITEEELNFK